MKPHAFFSEIMALFALTSATLRVFLENANLWLQIGASSVAIIAGLLALRDRYRRRRLANQG